VCIVEKKLTQFVIFSWHCEHKNQHMQQIHRIHIAAEMQKLADMGSKQRQVGIKPCPSEVDIVKQLKSMGISIQNVKYSAVVDFNKAQSAQARGWLNKFFSNGGIKAPAAPKHNYSYHPRHQARASCSYSEPVNFFTENNGRDDNFNVENRSKRGRGTRRRKLSRLSLSASIISAEPQASTSARGRNLVGKSNAVKDLALDEEQENAGQPMYCSHCRLEFTLETLVVK
jgi:hypothetical protein